MNSTGLILCCVASATLQSHAQHKSVVFQNIFSGRKVELKEGNEVHLRFTVHDTTDALFDIAISDVTLFGTIEFINDSSILLVSKNKTFDRVSLTIPVKSIEAFRKYSPLRPMLKTAATVAAAASGLLISIQISNSAEIFNLQNAGLAIATASAAVMSREFFSDRMKYFMVEGWRGRIVMRN